MHALQQAASVAQRKAGAARWVPRRTSEWRCLLPQVTNTSKALMHGLKLTLGADGELYRLPTTCLSLPALVPGLQYPFHVHVTCRDPETGFSGDVSVRIVREGTCVPVMCAIVSMPISEFDGE